MTSRLAVLHRELRQGGRVDVGLLLPRERRQAQSRQGRLLSQDHQGTHR